MKTRRLSAIAILLALLASSVQAEEDPTRRQARAQALWEEGAARYKLGKFDEAIDLFTKAFEVWPYPPILFNLCQSYRQKGDFKKAAFFCRAFLREDPEAENRELVENLILELDKAIEAEKSAAANPPEGIQRPVPAMRPDHAPAETTEPRWYRNGWAWAAFGGGVAALAGGATLIAIDGPRFDEQGRHLPDQNDTRGAGIGLAAGGAALVGTSIVLWVLGAGTERAAPSVTPTEGGGAIFTIEGKF